MQQSLISMQQSQQHGPGPAQSMHQHQSSMQQSTQLRSARGPADSSYGQGGGDGGGTPFGGEDQTPNYNTGFNSLII